MKTTKLMAAAAVTALVAQSGVAAVRPSTVQLSPAAVSQMNAGARIGTTSKVRRSNLTSTGTALAVVGVAAAGVGIAAAAGAFDSNHHDTVSP